MSLRTGGREAVEDTPVTGATEEQILAAHVRSWTEANPDIPLSEVEDDVISEEIDAMWQLASWLVPVGFVIVRAEDALTAEDRAAIGRAAAFMNTQDDDTPYGDDIDQFETDVATLSAIAAGGQE